MEMSFLKNKLCLSAALAGILVSCGGEESVTNMTQVSYAPMEVFGSESELPDCNAENEKQQALVTSDSSVRVCNNGSWSVLTGVTYFTDVSCNTSLLQDKSGYKVLCNGDSVGVILNGRTGQAGENSGTGCSIHHSSTEAFVVCGSDSVKVDLKLVKSNGTKIYEDDDGEEDDEDELVESVSMEYLEGYSQKGPFVKGSTVYLYELQDGKTLKQTNGNFTSTIDENGGHFKFNSRDLVSQYVLLQATGYYRNEVTDKVTSEMITLNAIVDVSARNSANINVLTHLEYPRVHYLVTVEKKKFKEAKKQAREEILQAFHIKTTEAFEDLNVNDGDELYTVSVMLQGNLTVAELTERLSKIAADIEKDGIWDDAQMRVSIVDEYLASGYEIRSDFSKEYGLPASCQEPTLLVAKNSLGEYDGKKLLCTRDGIGLPTWLDILVDKPCVFSAGEKTGKDYEPATTGVKGTYKGKFWIYDYECYDDGTWVLVSRRPTDALDTMIDARDGKSYAVVDIGGMTWMAENLNYADSVSYPSMLGKTDCDEYRDNADCSLLGRSYSWAAVMDYVNTGCREGYPCEVDFPVQGICPANWHVPDTNEYKALVDFIEEDNPGIENIKNVLKSEVGWINESSDYGFTPETNGTDKYGLALYRFASEFWLSNIQDDGYYNQANYWGLKRLRNIDTEYELVPTYYTSSLSAGNKVRCVKNKE